MSTSVRANSIAAGLQICFPDSLDYARRYLSEAKAGSGPRYSWNDASEIDDVAKRLVVPVPPGLDREKSIAALSQEGQQALLSKETFFIKAMRQAFPLLEGETVHEEKVTVLADAWGGASAGAVLYVRRGNLGTMAVVDGTKIVDAGSGALRLVPAPQRVISDGQILASEKLTLAAGGGLSTLRPVIGLLQMALFAFGPQGIAVAVGLGFLEMIFCSDEGEKPNLPKVINDLVEQDFANDHVKTDLATIVGYCAWLANQNTLAMAGELPDEKQQEYADALAQLKGYVVNACDPGSQLMTAISNLQNGSYTSDPPFSVVGLPAFLLGAALHLTFERARLLFSTDATTFRSPLAYNIVNAAKAYISYLDSTIDEIEQALAARLVVSAPTQGNFSEFVEGGRDGGTGVDRRYVYLSDASASKYPPQPVLRPSTGGMPTAYAPNIIWYEVCWPKDCSGTGSCGQESLNRAAAWRSAYVAGVRGKLEKKYNYTTARRDELTQARAALQKVIDTYQTVAPA